jgi:hypothetical protein
MKFRLSLAGLLAAEAAFFCGCSRSASPTPEKTATEHATPGAAPAGIAVNWPAVSMVLDGTDLVEMDKVNPEPSREDSIGGAYRSEQGGSILTLSAQKDAGGIHIERQYQEPGAAKTVKLYQLLPVGEEGFASKTQEAFLKKTKAGVIFWEKNSGVDSIPATYWVHYIRQ